MIDNACILFSIALCLFVAIKAALIEAGFLPEENRGELPESIVNPGAGGPPARQSGWRDMASRSHSASVDRAARRPGRAKP